MQMTATHAISQPKHADKQANSSEGSRLGIGIGHMNSSKEIHIADKKSEFVELH